MQDQVIRGLILKRLYEARHDNPLVRVPEALQVPDVSPQVLVNVCKQLGEKGLVRLVSFLTSGYASITAYGVDVVEGTAQPPISILLSHLTDKSVHVSRSSNVQIGDGNIQADTGGRGEPMREDTVDYVKRAFSRLREEAVQSAQKERLRVMTDATKQGALQSEGMLVEIASQYGRVATKGAADMVRLAFDATGSTAAPICAEVEQGLRSLRDALSNDLAQFFGSQAGWAPRMTTDGLGNEFLNGMDKHITASIDDFRHGMSGGARLTKDPLVSLISTISHSPGSVLQSGIGNVQRAMTSVAVNDIRSALAQFVNSREVQSLTGEDKQSVVDVVDVIEVELSKPQPDSSKIARWGKRLVDIAQSIGIGAAAEGLVRLLLG